jgi:hypothetical protein
MKQHESKFDPALETLWENGTQLNSFLRAGRTGEGVRQLAAEQQVRYDHAFRMLLEPNGFPCLARVPTIEEATPIRNVYSSPALVVRP